MKKIIFSLIALVTSMSINAQIVEVYQGSKLLTVFTNTSSLKVIAKEAIQYEYIDLGLPSGTLWATCNIGANSPEEKGYYFAWGETEPQYNNTVEPYTTRTYKWYKDSYGSICYTKYTPSYTSKYGYGDGKDYLEPSDDAATVNCGTNWKTPTSNQWIELFNSSYTDCKWTTLDNVKGMLITSKMEGYTDKSLFLPAAGYYNGDLYNDNYMGFYWTNELANATNASIAFCTYFYSSGTYYMEDQGNRFKGYSVRAVYSK